MTSLLHHFYPLTDVEFDWSLRLCHLYPHLHPVVLDPPTSCMNDWVVTRSKFWGKLLESHISLQEPGIDIVLKGVRALT